MHSFCLYDKSSVWKNWWMKCHIQRRRRFNFSSGWKMLIALKSCNCVRAGLRKQGAAGCAHLGAVLRRCCLNLVQGCPPAPLAMGPWRWCFPSLVCCQNILPHHLATWQTKPFRPKDAVCFARVVLHLASMPNSSHFLPITMLETLLPTIISLPLTSPQLPGNNSFQRLEVLAWQLSQKSMSLLYRAAGRARVQNGFVFTSQESLVSPHRLRVSPGRWCQPCPPHSPLGAVFVLHDDTFELDKAICVFHFAAFCFNIFTACFFFSS